MDGRQFSGHERALEDVLSVMSLMPTQGAAWVLLGPYVMEVALQERTFARSQLCERPPDFSWQRLLVVVYFRRLDLYEWVYRYNQTCIVAISVCVLSLMYWRA